MKKLYALTLLAILAFLTGGSYWDTYVFVESSRILCKGVDPYTFSNSVKAYLPSLGPMWIAYPPLPLILWYPPICALMHFKVPLSMSYVWAVKLVPTIFAALSAYLLSKKYGVGSYVALLPVVIVGIYLHGMFDSITAFFLLLMVYLLEEKRYWNGGLAYGLALASKQHALLALPALIVYLIRKGKRVLVLFSVAFLSAFIFIVLLYGLLIGNAYQAFEDVVHVMLFHVERPPNGLGFGGFSVLSVYSDAFNGYSGNLISAIVFKGEASVLHGPITKVSLPFLLIGILIVALVIDDLKVAIPLSYMVYLLFSYVGALQHLVVPAIFVPFLDNRGRKLFVLSSTLYATSHVLAFWDTFPIVIHPLLLRPYDLSAIALSRRADLLLPSWDVALKGSGLIFVALGLISALAFLAHEFRLRVSPDAGFLTPLAYALELTLLAMMLSKLSVPNLTTELSGLHDVAVYCWENTEYPGYRFGDYLTTPWAIPRYGYYSLVRPLAMRLVSELKSNESMALIVAKIDTLRSYQATDLMSSLMESGVKWAWAVVISKNDTKYVEGIASAPYSQLNRLFDMIKHNVPIKGYARLPPILDVLNSTLIKLPSIDLPYPKQGSCPIVYLIPLNDLGASDIAQIREIGKRYGLCVHVINRNVTFWNLKPSALST